MGAWWARKGFGKVRAGKVYDGGGVRNGECLFVLTGYSYCTHNTWPRMQLHKMMKAFPHARTSFSFSACSFISTLVFAWRSCFLAWQTPMRQQMSFRDYQLLRIIKFLVGVSGTKKLMENGNSLLCPHLPTYAPPPYRCERAIDLHSYDRRFWMR